MGTGAPAGKNSQCELSPLEYIHIYFLEMTNQEI